MSFRPFHGLLTRNNRDDGTGSLKRFFRAWLSIGSPGCLTSTQFLGWFEVADFGNFLDKACPGGKVGRFVADIVPLPSFAGASARGEWSFRLGSRGFTFILNINPLCRGSGFAQQG
jgi:hypothetical protein